MLPETLNQIPVVAALAERLPGAATGGRTGPRGLVLEISPELLVAVCGFLKREQEFARLSGITAVDRHPREPRFEVVYLLHSPARNQRLRLECRLGGEQPQIDSVTGVWAAADWYERETFDLFGIVFRDHPNLARILMPADWQGHPLRKDFPVHGHKYDYQHE